MKKVFKILMYLIVVVIVFVAGAIAYITIFLPNVGKPEDIKVVSTPERIEHGKYLATSVMVCMDCHSTRDWSKFSGPPIPSTLGKGGDKFDQSVGFPGVFYARNITPAGIGNWTDGEIFRTITTGVDKNNKALFPIMPYHYYGQLDKEDIYDVISYIKTLPSIKNEVPAPKPDFPFNIIEHLIPHKANLQTKPKESNTLAYGKYMTTASGCVECHT
ncbi:MAG: cytochrome C, partial [Bacteroidetes bacterium]|nr:cytochrome C [Bacteroidota bacterium]